MSPEEYVRAVLERLGREGFAPVTTDLAPPGAADYSLPLLGRSEPEGLRCVALVPQAGALAPAQRRSVARAWTAWAQQTAAQGQGEVRLALAFLFFGELSGGVQAELSELTAGGPGWELAIWAVDPTVRFITAFPEAAAETPGLSALAVTEAPVQHGRRFRVRRPDLKPWATWLLIGLNLAAFLLVTLAGQSLTATSDPNLMATFGAEIGAWVWEGEHWRLLTAMFLHWGLLHLGMNMWALYILGAQVEYLFGRWRFFVIYCVAGIAGNVLSLFLLSPYTPSAGASGAIFGLLGAFLYLKIGTPLGQRIPWRPLLEVLGINLIISFLPGVDIWGHLGGLLGGAAASAVVGLPATVGRRGRALAGVALLLAALLLCTPWVPLGPRGVKAFVAGMRARNSGDYQVAIAEFRAAVAVNPGLGRYHLRLGEAYALAGDRAQAVAEVARAAQLAPQDGQAQDYLDRLRQ